MAGFASLYLRSASVCLLCRAVSSLVWHQGAHHAIISRRLVPKTARTRGEGVGCLDDSQVRQAFERSNIPRDQWDRFAELLDAVERQEDGFRVADIAEYSLVEAHQKPDGSSMGTETYLLGVIRGIGLMLAREVGGVVRKRRADAVFMVFSDAPGIHYFAEDRQQGRGWGQCSVQGVLRGGQPVHRLSWGWSERSKDSKLHLGNAARERERILSFLPQ
jgi:hypothetical protein